MLKIIAILLVLVVAGVLAFAATKPGVFRVQRTASIKAPAEKIFPLIEDFQRWSAWSPWEKLDPDMKRTYSGPPSGKGAVYEWNGSNKVGQGRMEITDVSPPNRVTIKLDFLRPFEGHNTAEFTLDGRGDSTIVTWAMYGPNRYMAKVMSLFVSLDRMVGRDFETGLANLKAAAER